MQLTEEGGAPSRTVLVSSAVLVCVVGSEVVVCSVVDVSKVVVVPRVEVSGSFVVVVVVGQPLDINSTIG